MVMHNHNEYGYAKSQLNNDMINESIASFIKGNDAEYYNDIILKANEYNEYELNIY